MQMDLLTCSPGSFALPSPVILPEAPGDLTLPSTLCVLVVPAASPHHLRGFLGSTCSHTCLERLFLSSLPKLFFC